MAAESGVSCVTVFGGSGFLGSEIVTRLAAAGLKTTVAVRNPDRVQPAGPADGAGEILSVYADVRDETTVARALEGADAAVNAVGLYVERGAESFEQVHELGALNVAHQCARSGVRRLVHISGIGADMRSASAYVRARAKGELLVADDFPPAAILRPSVIFGPGDRFLNTFARIARTSPVLPLFGRGGTRLQPVYVADVAGAVHGALSGADTEGRTYELGGPGVYSYRDLIAMVLHRAGLRRLLVPVPFAVWDLLAAIASVLPGPPLTPAQVTLMKQDNVVADGALSLETLGVTPTSLEDVLPLYGFSSTR